MKKMLTNKRISLTVRGKRILHTYIKPVLLCVVETHEMEVYISTWNNTLLSRNNVRLLIKVY